MPNQRPRWRGVLHHYAFYLSLVAGVALIAITPPGPVRFATVVYGASLSALLGVSALFHRVTWSVEARRWMGRLDHSMIGCLIAGTFTPVCVAALPGDRAPTMMAIIWGGAILSMLVHLVWADVPKTLSAALYVALGWTGVIQLPTLFAHLGWTAPLLLLCGGMTYSAGAAVYALRRPDPLPTVFGYHEVFHALVVVAAMMHYAAVVVMIWPAA